MMIFFLYRLTAFVAILCIAAVNAAEPKTTSSIPAATGHSSNASGDENSATTKLSVDAVQNCVFMNQRHTPGDKAATLRLKPNCRYSITVSGAAFLSGQVSAKADPFPGMTVFYCTNEQDGYATQVKVVKPGDQISFVTPRRKSKDLFLSAFFLDYWPESRNRGQYELDIVAEPLKRPGKRISRDAGRILNINFGLEPRGRGPNSVIGGDLDIWTLIDVTERHKTGLPFADGTGSDVELRLSENDGEWGVADHYGVGHAYLYHNCRCVDLSLTLNYLPSGTWDVYVYAHGDAPDQNAAIEILSGETLYAGKSTLNNNTWDFRSQKLSAGNQYVKYTIDVSAGSPVIITSKRDGSNLSMFNAIQLQRHLQ